jgi:hypothetical protein
VTENPVKLKVLACAAIIEEIGDMPSGMDLKVLDFSLHIDLKKLKKAIQQGIDETPTPIEVIIPGHGLCSQAVFGSRSQTCSGPTRPDHFIF